MRFYHTYDLKLTTIFVINKKNGNFLKVFTGLMPKIISLPSIIYNAHFDNVVHAKDIYFIFIYIIICVNTELIIN